MPLTVANVDVSVYETEFHVIVNVPVTSDFDAAVYVKDSCEDAESVVPEPEPIVPKEADITQAIPDTSAVLVVAVTIVEDPIAKGGCENVTDVGKEYIALDSTVDTAVVLVDANMNVKVC